MLNRESKRICIELTPDRFVSAGRLSSTCQMSRYSSVDTDGTFMRQEMTPMWKKALDLFISSCVVMTWEAFESIDDDTSKPTQEKE